jgi:hypothetical protein
MRKETARKMEGDVLNSTVVIMSDEMMESVTAQDQDKRIFNWGPHLTLGAQNKKATLDYGLRNFQLNKIKYN